MQMHAPKTAYKNARKNLIGNRRIFFMFALCFIAISAAAQVLHFSAGDKATQVQPSRTTNSHAVPNASLTPPLLASASAPAAIFSGLAVDGLTVGNSAPAEIKLITRAVPRFNTSKPKMLSANMAGVSAMTVNPVPYIQSMSPVVITPGAGSFSLTLKGSGFAQGAVVKWNGTALSTNVQSSTQVLAVVPANLTSAAGTAVITVINAKPTGVVSNGRTFSITTSNTTFNFGPSVFAPIAVNNPVAVLATPLNADVTSDLVVLDATDATAQIYVNSGSGRMNLTATASVGSSPVAVTVGDFNEDGKTDIAVVNSTGTVTLLIGDGTGKFPSSNTLSTGSNGQAIVTGDFNGDGHLDLAVLNQTNGTVEIFMGNGAGVFVPASTASVGTLPYGLVLGDFTGDGVLDLAVGNGDGTVSLLAGNAAGGFNLVSTTTTATAANGLVAGDFNEDGLLDLAVAGSSGGLSILAGNGSGSFSIVSTVTSGIPNQGIAVGDFNGDGHLDLAMTKSTSGQIAVLLGTGQATFNAGPVVAAANAPASLSVGDFNGDGKTDIAVANPSGNSVQVLMQEPLAVVTPATVAFGSQLLNATSPSQSISISNQGSVGLTVTAIALNPASNTAAADFSQTNTCGTLPVILSAGASCIVNVSFVASKAANESATFGVTDNSGGVNASQKVVLSGTGITGYTTQASITAPSISYGSTAQITATIGSQNSTPTGMVSLVVGTNAALTQTLVNGSTTFSVAGLTPKSYKLTLTYSAQNNFNASSATSTLVVNPTSTSVSIQSAPFPFGQQGTVTVGVTAASGNPSGNVSLMVGSSTLAPQTLNSAGVATFSIAGLSAGTTALTAAYAAQGNFAASSASSSQVVTRATPAITWASPAPIVQGTALSSTQLNAKASVAGTFAYNPPLGTVLQTGNAQALTAMFTPSDTVDYSSPSATVSINVTAPIPVAVAKFSAASLSFSSQSLQSPSGVQTISLTNNGTLGLSLTSVTLSGNNATSFQFVSPAPSTACITGASLAPQATCTLDIVFVPTVIGTNQSSIKLTDNAGGGSQTLPISGIGVNPPVAFLNPLVPGSVTPGVAGSGFNLNLSGGNLSAAAVARWNGTALATTVGGLNQLHATVPAGLITGASTGMITVVNSSSAGTVSNTQNITITTPANNLNLNSGSFAPLAVNQPVAVVLADFNGDKKTDLAVLDASDSNVQVFVGAGSGREALKSTVSVPAGAVSMTSGDLNGDGKLDLAVLTSAGSVIVLTGDGTGNFTAGTPFTAGSSGSAIAVADFNRDGFLDIVTVNPSTSTVTVLLGNSSGTFSQQGAPTVGTQPYGVAIGDYSSDGILDLAVGNSDGSVSILKGDGIGNFALVSSPTTGAPANALTAGDFNEDGLLDLAVINGNGTVSVLLGGSGAAFTAGPTFNVGTTPRGIVAGDLNGDGHLDLAVTNGGANTVSFLYGAGNGSFTSGGTTATGTSPSTLALGDLNGDGRLDLTVANGTSNTVSNLLQTPLSSYSPSSVVIGSQAVQLMSIPQNVTISNTGPLPLLINSIAITRGANNGPNDFTQTNTCGSVPVTLAVGASCVVSVSLSPSNLGPETAQLVIADNMNGIYYTPHYVSLSGVGVPVVPTTTSVSVPSIPYGAPAIASVGVTSAVGTPSGNVTVLIGSNSPISAPVVNGSAMLTIPGITAGTYTVTANFNGNTPYGTSTATGSLTVSPVAPVLQWNTPSPIATSVPLSSMQLNAIASVPGAFTYTPAAGTNLGVGKYQPLSVSFAPTDGVDYLPATAKTSIDVKANPVPYINPLLPSAVTPSLETAGFTLKLTGTGFVPGSVVKLNGVALVTSFVSSTALTAVIPPATLTPPAVSLPAARGFVTVNNPETNSGGVSVPVLLPITTPVSTLNFSPNAIPLPVTQPAAIVLADLNGDGNQEAIVLDPVDSNVQIFSGNATGGFTAVYTLPVTVSANPVAFALGDFNEDGKIDLAVISKTGVLSLLLGNGKNNFTLSQTTTIGNDAISISAADLDSDGHLDLAVLSSLNGTVTSLLGNGSGSFSVQSTTSTGTSPYGLAIGDYNQDGVLDLAVGNGDGSVSVLLGNGGGGFSLASSPTTGSPATAIAMGDFSEDGIPDLAVANTNGTVTLLTGGGGGNFTLGGMTAVSTGASSMVVSDFDGDGHLDLAVANGVGGTFSVLLGTGKGSFTPRSFPAGIGPVSLAAGDFNNDGRADLAIANYGSNSVSIFLQTPLAGFSVASLNYGMQTVAAPMAPQTVTLTNNGSALMTITAIGITPGANTGAGDFTQTNTCAPFPAVLTPGTSCFVSVTLSASSTLAESAILNVTDNSGGVAGSIQSVALSSTGAQYFTTQTALSVGPSAAFGAAGTASVVVTSPNGTPVGNVILGADGYATFNQPLVNGAATFAITGLATGAHQLTATFSAQGSYGASNSAGQFMVTQATPTLTWATPASILIGTPLSSVQLNAVGSVAGTKVYSLPAGTVLPVGANQPLSVTLTPIDSRDYAAVTANTTISVLAGPTPVFASPNALSYANQPVNFASAPQVSTISNTTTSSITLKGLSLGGASYAQYAPFTMQTGGTACIKGGVLAAGTSCTVTIIFKPTVVGPFAAVVSASYSIGTATTQTTLTVPLSGSGSLNPVPLIQSLATPSVTPVVAAAGFNLTIRGTGFETTSVVTLNGKSLATKLVANGSAPYLTAVVPAGLITSQSSNVIYVVNAKPTLVSSNPILIAYTNEGDTLHFAQGPFTAPTVASPSVVLSVDLNGDRIPDLVAIDSLSGSVYTYTAANSGRLTLVSTIPIPGGPVAVTTGDFNEDGKMDVAVVNASGEVTVLTGVGAGAFTAGTPFSAGSSGQAIATADFNSDGHLDLVVTNPVTGTATVLLGSGASSFTQSSVSSTGVAPYGVALADFNQDGITDLAVGNGDGTVSILAGDGFGGFTPVSIAPSGSPATALTVADFNEDGIPDLAVTNTNNLVTILTGNGNGLFSLASQAAVGNGPLGSALGDFNGDGHQDIAVINSADKTISVLYGTGNATFTPQNVFPAGDTPLSLSATDANSDGRFDLVLGNGGSQHNVSVLEQTPLSTFTGMNFNYGSQNFGTTSAPQSFTFSNSGSAPLVVSSFLLHPGYESKDFPATTTCPNAPFTLNPQASCTVTVIYTPSRVGVEAAVFAVTDNNENVAGSPHYVNFNGFGVADPTTVSITAPATLVYGSSTAVSVTVTSPVVIPVGYVTLNVGSFAVQTLRLSTSGTAVFQLSGMPAGTYPLTVAYATQSSFAPSSATQSLLVQQGSPMVVWPNPASITQGTPLSSTQLNASTSIAGNFTYSPAAGSVLQAGNSQNLSATFTPLDKVDYTTVTATTSINVQPSTISATLTSTALLFPNQTIGTLSMLQSATLINTGATPIVLANVAITGSNASSFQFASPAPSTSCLSVGGVLPVGSSCTLDVLFDPTQAGASQAAITLTDSADSGTQTVGLSGLGILPASPFVQSVSPSAVSLTQLANGFQLNVRGTGFASGAVILLNGKAVTTTGQGTSLMAQVPAGILAGPLTATLVVSNPAVGGVTTSNPVFVPITLSTLGVSMSSAAVTPYPVSSPQGSSIGDFNGDGISDLAVLDTLDGQLFIYLGTGKGGFTLFSTTNVGATPVSLVSGDFNEDGKVDLAVLSSSGMITLCIGDGTGNFSPGTPFSGGANGQSIAAADLNGDGHLDLAVVNPYAVTATILLGSGNGSFSFSATLHTGNAPYAIAVADYNADNKLDLAIGNTDGTVSVFLGNGDGTFALASSPDSGAPGTALVSGDFNQDGIPDLAVAMANGVVAIWTGAGNGLFTEVTTLTVGNNPQSLIAQDFNGDGFLDLAVANAADGSVQILNGNGSNGFSVSSAIPAGTLPSALQVGDFDGDGRLDVAVINSSAVTVLLQVPVGAVSVPSVLFPVQTIGTTSTPTTFTIGNSGSSNQPLMVSTISITPAYNTPTSDFVQTNTCGTLPAVLPSGASCTVSVTFTPSGVELENATLNVSDNSGGVPASVQSVALSGTSPLPAGILATSQINPVPGLAIAPSFLGLSFDWNTFTSWAGSSVVGADPIFAKLMNNFGAYNNAPLSIRIAGDSIATGTISSDTVVPFTQLAQNANVHYILGVNFDLQTPSLTQGQTATYANALPQNVIDAFEIGNEPDNYVSNGARGSNYGTAPYLIEREAYQQGVMAAVPSPQRFAGPALAGSGWLSGIKPGIPTGQIPVSIFTQHSYVGCKNTAHPYPADYMLLPFATTSAPRLYGPVAAIAHAAGMQYRMGEMNSICSGGQAGLSDNFATALWGIDTMFAFANAGVDGVNWHTASGSAYSVFQINVAGATGKQTYSLQNVNPLYYSLLFFAQATGNGARFLPVTTLTNSNTDIWSTVDQSGTIHVVIINKDEVTSGSVQFSVPGYTTGTVIPLTSTNYLSNKGVSLGGQTFDGSLDGSIQGKAANQLITAQNGVFTVSLGTTSAILINMTK